MSSLSLTNQPLLLPGILSGVGTSSSTADVTITYAQPYTSAPSVFISIGSNTVANGYIPTLVVTATNFTVSIDNAGGNPVAVAFNWLAVGQND